jgi:dTDP-4-dehydrorhamnose reductase
MKLESMRIGITGGNGILGRELQESFKIHHPGFAIGALEGDIFDQDGLRAWANAFRPNVVIHLAAVVPTNQFSSESSAAFRINALGPSAVATEVSSVMGAGLRRFVYVSSSHVYQSAEGSIDESGSTAPASLYGKSKLEGEVRLLAAAKSLPANVVVARLFSIFSPLQRPPFLYPSLRERIALSTEGQKISVSGWNHTRDFLPAWFAADLLAELCLTRFEGLVNVGSAIPRTVADFAEALFGVVVDRSEGSQADPPTSLVANVQRLEAVLGGEIARRLPSLAASTNRPVL